MKDYEGKQRKAIIIVHGIGEQKSFDTLFDFHEGIYSFLGKALKWRGDNLKEEYEKFKGDNNKKAEIQNRILEELKLKTDEHLLPREVGLAKEAYIDILYRDEVILVYEVWWAKDFTPPKVFSVFKWLFNSALIPFKKSILSSLLGVLTVLTYLLVSLIYVAILTVYYLSKFVARLKILKPLFGKLRNLIEKCIINIVGDVEIYINEKDEAQKILDILKDRIQALLNDEKIAEVNVVGHSLGSVITYEALCDLTEAKQSNLNKIKNYITAGAPLDKIRYFFGTERRFNREIGESINWVNYYAIADLVAGKLDYFKRPVINIKVANRIPLAHCQYWNNIFVIKDIINRISTFSIFKEYPVENRTFFASMFCWSYAVLMFILGISGVALTFYLIIRLILLLI